MYKIFELNRSQVIEVFTSMAKIRQVIVPKVILEVNLNFETSRSALETLEGNNRLMIEDPELLLPTILPLVLYETDKATLPESVSQEVKDQIPAFILTQ
ncbi:MAG: hypothetical protein D4R97_05445 [Bacteroidetes bacterium]|nr:MAG: hypothetical protein D4R97_05445 [Bacteroidota bacterium]